MARVRTASLDTVPPGQLTAAFVTMHLATDDVAVVMELMDDQQAVWTQNQKAIDLKIEFMQIVNNFEKMGLCIARN